MGEYEIKISNFEGPLDLLLHLVRKNEIDITTISLADIVDEYLQYLEHLKSVNINLAGDFLAVASTLLRIKAQVLLPSPDTDEDNDDFEQQEYLVQQLLEYRYYAAVSEVLESWQSRQIQHFQRGSLNETPEPKPEIGKLLKDVSLLKMALIFRNALADIDDSDDRMVVERDEVSLEAQKMILVNKCKQMSANGIMLQDILRGLPSKLHLVTTFLALLECIYDGIVYAVQEKMFGNIILFWKESMEA